MSLFLRVLFIGEKGERAVFPFGQGERGGIMLLSKSGTKTVKFVDRTFNCEKKRAYEIFSFLMEKKEKRGNWRCMLSL